MSYIPTEWQDRIVERPRTYHVQNNPDGTITLIPAPGTVVQEGTPVNAANLNKLEQGLVQIEHGLESHKDRHASGGPDALTPADIGAAASEHTHAQFERIEDVLLDITTTTRASTITLDLSGVNTKNYGTLRLLCQNLDGRFTSAGEYFMTLNGVTYNAYRFYEVGDNYPPPSSYSTFIARVRAADSFSYGGAMQLVYFTYNRTYQGAITGVNALSWATEGSDRDRKGTILTQGVIDHSTFSNGITSITIRASNTNDLLEAGARFVLYGVKL